MLAHSVLLSGGLVLDSVIATTKILEQLLHQELVRMFKWPSRHAGCVAVAGLFHTVMVVRTP
tara:strand:+ start:311 stop:496 length:186 start_codon:yes stop_codon:yes gene_type:complete